VELLSAILSEKSENLNQQDRAKWLSRLLHWFQRSRSSDEKEINWEKIYTTRLKFIILQLRGNPEWRKNVENNFRQVLIDLITSHQLSTAGLPDETSFFQDLFHRLQDKILPEGVFRNDLGSILKHNFDRENEIVIIDAIDESTIEEFINEVFQDKSDFTVIKHALHQSLIRTSIQIANSSLLLSNKLFKRGFLNWENAENIAKKILFEFSKEENNVDVLRLFEQINELEKVTMNIQENIGKMGVEIETVYTLQIQLKRIKRFKLLINFLNDRSSLALASRLFFSELVRDVYESRGLKAFLASNLELLSKRVVQGNSAVGEHYVARTWDDVRTMFLSALGGGLITAFTVFFKHVLSFVGLSGFLKGLADSINYSFSFLAIQLAGFTLATKQPSTTAAFLAKTLAKSTRESGLAIFYILRAQIVAVIGNISAVIPVCFLISFTFQQLGQPIMGRDEAYSVLKSSALLGPTLLFACFTGGLLFLSSLIAGWFENFCIVTDLPDRIKFNSKISAFLGKNSALKISEFLRENSNALAANISLGFLLGLVPQLLKFMSLPLEAKHVTLSSGAFASALPIILAEGNYSSLQFVDSIAGLLMIGVCNLLVSFSLSLTLALAASEGSKGSFVKLLRWTGKTILRRPYMLVYPEKSKNKK
jgi:site-specific recombinase